MKVHAAPESAEAIAPDEVRQAMEELFRSKHFVNAHKKQKFVRLICDFYLQGRARELNEHILGYDVFGRDSTYNPSDDPIVRVFAHEIRKKLDAYYTGEGANSAVRLEIPAGSYQPVFTRQATEPAQLQETATDPTPEPNIPRQSPRLSARTVVAGIVILGLAVAVTILAMTNRQLRREITRGDYSAEPATFGPVWTTFLAGKSPPLVIISNPPVLRFTNASDPESVIKASIPLPPESVEAFREKFVTSPEVSIKDSRGPGEDSVETPDAKIVIERNQRPALVLSTNVYTGMGEAIGLHYLTDFFRKANRAIQLKQSRTLSAEDLKKHNVIMLGGVWVNAWSSKLTQYEDFVFTSKGTIENRNPQAGEEREYIPQFDRRTGNLIEDYALITLKPNISEANDVILLAGVYSQGTEAAADFVTNSDYLDQFNLRLKDTGRSSRYFQALVRVGVENGIPTTIAVVALHELRLA